MDNGSENEKDLKESIKKSNVRREGRNGKSAMDDNDTDNPFCETERLILTPEQDEGAVKKFEMLERDYESERDSFDDDGDINGRGTGGRSNGMRSKSDTSIYLSDIMVRFQRNAKSYCCLLIMFLLFSFVVFVVMQDDAFAIEDEITISLEPVATSEPTSSVMQSTYSPTKSLREAVNTEKPKDYFTAICSVSEQAIDLHSALLDMFVSKQYKPPTHIRLGVTACPSEIMIHFTVIQKLPNGVTEDSKDVSVCDTDIPANNPFVVVYGKDLLTPKAESRYIYALRIGCVHYHSTNEIWHFYAATLTNIEPRHILGNGDRVMLSNEKPEERKFVWIEYRIGQIDTKSIYGTEMKDIGEAERNSVVSKKFRIPENNPKRTEVYGIVGDLDMRGSPGVFNQLSMKDNQDTTIDFLLHLGDSSYATNNGHCYNPAHEKDPSICAWNCPASNKNCGGRDRQSQGEYKKWVSWLPHMEKISSEVPWMTTTGNHDNDLTWFLKFRPPLNSSMPNVKDTDVLHLDIEGLDTLRGLIRKPSSEGQILANELMSRPYFYSFDYGSVHFISIGTEDNAINPYEMWDGKPLSKEQLERFEMHYGVNSPQYKWLRNELVRSRSTEQKTITPWVVVFTHRPIYSSSSHHPMCSGGGDWYGCKVRELYAPLFEEFNVTLVFSGHSHTYQRSLPLKQSKKTENGVTYIVCGTGGYELSGHFYSDEKMAITKGDEYGYCRLKIFDRQRAQLEFISSQGGKVGDKIELKNTVE